MEKWRESITPNERDKIFYRQLAGGAKALLLKSVIDFELPALLIVQGPLSSEDVAQKLALHPHRTKKWLHLLSLLGLVEKVSSEEKRSYGDELYTIGPLGQGIFGEDGKNGEIFITYVDYWRWVEQFDFNAVLRGLPLPDAVRWPPRNLEAATELHQEWMGNTAQASINAIEKAVDISKVKRLLDVGGGDATMACTFAKAYPNLEITIFDIPECAYLARNKIAQAHLTDRVSVVPGDFLSEQPLPTGFDAVLWSRTLVDWSANTVTKLLQKTHEALIPEGQVIICETLLEDNEDIALAWEIRYLFYDDFQTAVFKPKAVYEQMLTETGFKVKAIRDQDEDICYSVIIGKRV